MTFRKTWKFAILLFALAAMPIFFQNCAKRETYEDVVAKSQNDLSLSDEESIKDFGDTAFGNCPLTTAAPVFHIADQVSMNLGGGAVGEAFWIFRKKLPDGSAELTRIQSASIVQSSASFRLAYPYSDAFDAGKYSVFVGLRDPQGIAICRSNDVMIDLVPSCSLLPDRTIVAVGDAVTYRLQAPANLPSTAPIQTVLFFGQKNTVDDLFGITMAASGSGGYKETMTALGSYTRFAEAKDAAGKMLCRSNTLGISVQAGVSPQQLPGCSLSFTGNYLFSYTFVSRVGATYAGSGGISAVINNKSGSTGACSVKYTLLETTQWQTKTYPLLTTALPGNSQTHSIQFTTKTNFTNATQLNVPKVRIEVLCPTNAPRLQGICGPISIFSPPIIKLKAVQSETCECVP